MTTNYDPEKIDPDAQVSMLRSDCRNRLKCRQLVDWVFVKQLFASIVLDDNLKTINFENDEVPLWERIGKADKLATYFKEQRAKMTERAEALQKELKDEAKETRCNWNRDLALKSPWMVRCQPREHLFSTSLR